MQHLKIEDVSNYTVGRQEGNPPALVGPLWWEFSRYNRSSEIEMGEMRKVFLILAFFKFNSLINLSNHFISNVKT